jgi:hypothetical protein
MSETRVLNWPSHAKKYYFYTFTFHIWFKNWFAFLIARTNCSIVCRTVTPEMLATVRRNFVQSRAINVGRQGHSLTQSKMLHRKTVVNIIMKELYINNIIT